jgi:hypothetical protein
MNNKDLIEKLNLWANTILNVSSEKDIIWLENEAKKFLKRKIKNESKKI